MAPAARGRRAPPQPRAAAGREPAPGRWAASTCAPGSSLLSAAAAGADEKVGVVGAVAIELVHNFSLIHDDIIDGDLERRHRPTVWAEYGVGQAIIAGDALATLALQILLDEPTPERVRAAVPARRGHRRP